MSEATNVEAVIGPHFMVNEREAVWLIGPEENSHLVYFRVDKDKWLEVQCIPANYPGCHVALLHLTEEQLRDRLHSLDVSFDIRQCIIPGVRYLSNGPGAMPTLVTDDDYRTMREVSEDDDKVEYT